MSQLISPDIAPELQGQPPQSDIHSHPSQSQTQASLSSMSSQSRPDPNLDPKLSGDTANPAIAHAGAALQLGGLDSSQILTLLRHLPGVFNKGGLKDSTAEQLQQHISGRPLPGPSSNFTFTTTPGPELPTASAIPPQNGKGTKRKRGGRALGSSDDIEGEDAEDWTRQRKDNHKEVERRRRGNINEGINELARIVPNGSGEKAKGAILNRAVQYIHHLKENEARNIEKWTLEKLLMDQAMGDLQAQLEDLRRLWDEERQAKERALLELDVIRAGGSSSGGNSHQHSMSMPNAHPNPYERRTGQDMDLRERAYHPSDRHRQGHRGSDANGSGSQTEMSDGHMQNADMEMVESHLSVPRDPDVARGQLGLRDPDVAEEGDTRASADAEADAEGEEGGGGGNNNDDEDEDDDDDDDDDDERPVKRMNVE